MADDGTGGSISIPSFIVSDFDLGPVLESVTYGENASLALQITTAVAQN